MKLAGHRGLAGIAPENTLAGVHQAAKHNIGWVEVDVQLSQDGVPVIIHDETVNRCSNGSGSVRELSWQQLQQLDFGSWFAEQYQQERIPNLSQLLACCKELALKLNLEIKLYPEDDIKRLVQTVADTLAQSAFAADQLIISSFSHEALLQCQEMMPSIRRGHLWEGIPDDWAEQLSEIDAFSVHCDYQRLTQIQAAAIKRAGYELYTYTPNDPTTVAKHWQWGVDMMISDNAHLY
ncbi:glycerophosphoryl diester phosphodiesterase [Celerinatantimonas yamalensis]|uniref:Glycerophosphoryl diester phosphodiesterase n=1 Tax=Celerinatantimonas yamalensis TaxID=559956 RepID=A0ABW9GB38_9GAMM